MLKAEALDQLSKVLGVPAEDLKTKITATEEHDIEVPELFTKTDVDSLSVNKRKEGFEEGKKAMTEIFTKDLSKKVGIETTKDIDDFIGKFTDKVKKESGKQPDEVYEALKSEKTQLQQKLQEAESEKENIKLTYEQKLFARETKSEILGMLPEGTIIPKSDIAVIFFNEHSIEKDEDGKRIVKRGNEILKDKALNPLPLDTVLKAWLDERKFVAGGGMGGGSGQGAGGRAGKFKTMDEFVEYAKANGIDPNTTESLKYYNEHKEK